MPAIELARLRARTAALAAEFAGTQSVAASVRRLLDDYADRTHRPSPRVANNSIGNAFKTPAPVVRAIVVALRGPAQDHPAAALAVADELWAGGSQEERRIAAHLLGQVALQQPAQALAQIEAWVPHIEGRQTADALAEFGLGPLMRADPAHYLAEARRWVTHPRKWVRRFGLAALMPLVKDKQWDNVPGALAVLRPVMTETDGDVRRAAASVLEGLSRKSPAEISRFLREQAARSSTSTGWIVRKAMTALDSAEQAAIVRLLRS